MADYTIAILGRPNVGKSTLFNRLVGKTHAIVSPVEGVTRDRIYGTFDWLHREFDVIDTGGYIPHTEDEINKHVRLQADIAAEEADFLILLVDGRSELTSSEKTLAELIIAMEKPFILVANKIDDISHEKDIFGLYELGMGDPMPVSAQSGRSLGDLLDEIHERLPQRPPKKKIGDDIINLAIIGMPNVGKSSLMNNLLKEEKSIVTDIAGTTRDSVDSYMKHFGRDVRMIDTAGLRRKAKVSDSIEFYSAVRTNRVLEECDVALVLIDATKGFGNQDRDIARAVMDSGKGLVLVVNKWDAIEKDTDTMKDFMEEIEYRFMAMQHYPILFISVKNNRRVTTVLDEAVRIFDARRKKMQTSNLNEFMMKAVGKYPPPGVKGKHLKIKYVTQVHHSPPILAFYTNHPDLFPIAYKRYLENQLRQTFDLKGVPIRISFRHK
ncbi:MAG: ribosome biogenesis GTPase Der [Candidatus Marinimicrobia bacterium]|nr:ribosome biogenesis GTPase Der [Candidatus Neomarinimicrobiota bacterium]